MPKALTTKDFINRLKYRNEAMPNNQVFLFPKKQQYVNQNYKLQFKCIEEHVWSARPGNILSGQGCPECKLHNDSLKKRKDIEKVLKEFYSVHGDRYDYSKMEYKNLHTHILILCSEHGEFKQTPSCHFYGKQGCPKCAKDKAIKPQQKFIDEANIIHENKYDYSKVKYKNTYTPVVIICPVHGEFSQLPYLHLQKHGCKKCVLTSVSYKQLSWLTHIAKEENINIQHAANGGEYIIPFTNYKCDGFCKETNTIYEFNGDAFHGNPNRYSSDEKCHPFNKEKTAFQLYDATIKKENKIKELGYNIVSIWESDFDKMNIPLLKFNYSSVVHVNHHTPDELLNVLRLRFVDDEFKGFKYKHKYQCLLCGDEFITTLSQRKQTFVKRGIKGCPKCAITKKVDFPLSVQNSLLKAGIKNSIVLNDGVVLLTDERVGIYIVNFATDVEKNIGKYANLEKLEEYNKKGIRLLFFYQDEWINNKNLIVKKIKHISKIDCGEKIYARKCLVRCITSKEKSNFLSKYHIQGNDNSSIFLGAFYEDNLVAVMTFSKPRIAVGGRINEMGSMELVRFATCDDYHVVGIASKLLTFFERENPNKMIYSFADRRWSIGNLYEKMGFKLESVNPPDYFYIINGSRKHRWNYRKDILRNTLPSYNPDMTEYQNMLNAGYDRIWGCGTIKYIKNSP